MRQIQGQIKLVKVHNTQEGVTKEVIKLANWFDSSVDEKAPCGTCNLELNYQRTLQRFLGKIMIIF